MRTDIVFTLTGTDRVGIVEEVTKTLYALGANVGTSRMARLGGEFAILMLLSLPKDQLPALDRAMEDLAGQGFNVTTTETKPVPETTPRALEYRIGVEGADHEGIVHGIAHELSQRGINIESMETGTRAAPVSGTPLFFMTAEVAVPADLPEADWTAELERAASLVNVDVTVTPVEE